MKHLSFPPCFQVWIIVMFSVWKLCYTEDCGEPGWFGPECQYKCRCTDNQCDPQGNCQNMTSCQIGWFGPACQYVDLASIQPNPNLHPQHDKSVNGQNVTCNIPTNQNSTTLTVNLTQPYPLTWLRLHFRNTGRLPNLEVEFRNRSSSQSVSCRDNMVTSATTNKVLDIYCGLRIIAEQVVLKGDGVESLCSLYLSGGRNVALKQNTTQSSMYKKGPNSSAAVDGNTSGNWFHNSCTHTNLSDMNPSWNVTFSMPYLVNSYVLHNRDTNKYRLKKFILTSYDKDGKQIFYHQDQDKQNEGQPKYTIPSLTATMPVTHVNIRANFSYNVTVRSYWHTIILTLCEVEIYADCPPGTYGQECERTCNCAAENASCFVITGACPSGCAVGYTGESCDQKIVPDRVTGTLVAVGAGVSILLILVFITVLFWRRCRHPKAKMGRLEGLPVDDVRPAETSSSSESESPTPSTSGHSSTRIAVKDMDVFMTSRKKEFFVRQFYSIPSNSMATTAVGMSTENKAKNRYKNICAYDHSRVHLDSNKETGLGDYINASFIQGYQTENRFIASQGPTKTMIKDFARMLWEQQVEKVVMLTNLVEDGKVKCELYWPANDGMQFGDIRIELTTTQRFADYTIRRLRLRKEGEPVQNLTQFHFTSWPDKDIPTTPWGLVDFEQRVASLPTFRPIVVHCSAGIGRTGTFIALHNIMREATDTGHVDFFTTVQKLRQDRMNMVQTAEQYEFLHRAVQVALVCMGTTVTSSDIHNRISTLEKKSKGGQTCMEAEFKAICSMCDESHGDDEDEDELEDEVYQNSRIVFNRLKNRLSNVLPKEYYRVELKREKKDTGTYINAVFLPSFSQENQQILTQLPLPTTINDFWRLVAQYNVALIVAFQLDLKNTDTTIGDYLPVAEGEAANFSNVSVSPGQVTSGEFWEERQLAVTTSRERKVRLLASPVLDRQRRVIHLQCKTTNLDPDRILTLVKQIRSLNPVGEGRTLYMCRDGAAYSGLICVLSLLLDRLDNDHKVTIPLVVGAMKAIRPQVIPSLDQYQLLYEAVKEYIDTSNIYSNFGDNKS